MKKMVRLMVVTLVLLSAVSISSFADGGAPTPHMFAWTLRREVSFKPQQRKI